MFLIMTTNHSLLQIESEWDFPRLERWLVWCEKHPPMQLMVAAYLGFGAKAEPMRVTEKNFDEFLSMLSVHTKTGGNA